MVDSYVSPKFGFNWLDGVRESEFDEPLMDTCGRALALLIHSSRTKTCSKCCTADQCVKISCHTQLYDMSSRSRVNASCCFSLHMSGNFTNGAGASRKPNFSSHT